MFLILNDYNRPEMCGRTFSMKVPFEGAKLEMFSDLESRRN